MSDREKDWLTEVWRIKRELSTKALKMGLEKYLELAEKEAEKIFPKFPFFRSGWSEIGDL